MIDFPSVYQRKEIEDKWNEFWEKENLYHVEPTPDKEPYCIVIPPPNITGSLHMGHALDETLQDILIRYHRMRGYVALWIPGCDHAGIATQNVVERELAKKGLRKEDLGREEFEKMVWEWKEKHEGRIKEQLKKLGASCDWERWAFTMDEKRAKAVRVAFVRLYKEGLIYRENYIVNWCPRCETALSDIEVEYKEEKGYLYYIHYPIKGGGEITVATTRPETMLGDTGVAVHPEDKRYQRLIGKTVILPLVGREIPIVADERVDPEFGTGAVKVTPAHDPVDFLIGKEKGLERVVIMDKKGIMNENAGKFKGLDRFTARKAIVEELRKEGYLLKFEEYTHSVGHCYRCDTIIEPYVTPQWFVKVKDLAQPAIKAVKKGRIKFIPPRWERIYLEWMENIKDWCISRQIWWGHRIPVWKCKKCGKDNVEVENPQVCQFCGSKELEQEEDVLDTWFSSGLWPLSTLGWPEETEDFRFFYPTSTLVTGYEIIFFWVARMIMFGLKFTGKVPFREVYIHPIVRDSKGRKMSKSLGNVVDPLELIDKYGCDALRMALASLSTGAGQDIFYNEERFVGMRNFSNKVWNACRFVFLNLDEDFRTVDDISSLPLNRDDRYILSRLDNLIQQITENLESRKFSESASLLYSFFWHDYCDWYLEFTKERMHGEEKKVVLNVHLYVLDNFLRLLHPYMPYITEEVWSKMKKYLGISLPSISLASWPETKGWYSPQLEEEEKWKFEVITAARSLRKEWEIPLKEKREFYIKSINSHQSLVLKEEKDSIGKMMKAQELFIDEDFSPSHGFSRTITPSGAIVFMALGDMDIKREEGKLKRELEKIEERLKSLERKLNNRDFLEKASPEVVEKIEKEREACLSKRERLLENLKILKGDSYGGIETE